MRFFVRRRSDCVHFFVYLPGTNPQNPELMPLFIPKEYTAKLAPETMEQAITYLKEIFPDMLARSLRLRRVTAPLFVRRARASTTTSTAWNAPCRSRSATWANAVPKWCTRWPSGNA